MIYQSNIISEVSSNNVLTIAFENICNRRKKNPDNSCILHLMSKRQIRKIIKKMHEVMKELKFKLALDKTYIGRIEKGFEFLGHGFEGGVVTYLAKGTIIGNFNINNRALGAKHF